jgi:hypothetical protein
VKPAINPPAPAIDAILASVAIAVFVAEDSAP